MLLTIVTHMYMRVIVLLLDMVSYTFVTHSVMYTSHDLLILYTELQHWRAHVQQITRYVAFLCGCADFTNVATSLL